MSFTAQYLDLDLKIIRPKTILKARKGIFYCNFVVFQVFFVGISRFRWPTNVLSTQTVILSFFKFSDDWLNFTSTNLA